MNFLLRIIVVGLIIIICDIYFYRLLKNLFFRNKKGIKLLKAIVLLFTLLFISFEAGLYFVVGYPLDDFVKYRELFALLNVFILVYLPKLFSALFLILCDFIAFISSKINQLKGVKKERKKHSWVYITALTILLVTLIYCIYGFVYEKTNLKIQKLELFYNNLPDEFDGFTIAQISDIHLGSYTDTKAIEKYVEKIRQLSPDMLVMTGDMINVSDKELEPFYQYFRSINPPYGKYSILGNHDIGDYFTFKKAENQNEITRNLIRSEQNMGFTVLVDTACYIKKNNDSIALIGVNNWGNFPFKHSGNLPKALINVGNSDFKILLSHDPNHWKQEVTDKTNIELTLSGHTHAMQLAFISKYIKFSPSQIIFPNWYGLYTSGEQKLYVNPGLGYSGFSARIGTRPEITLITLRRSK